MEPPRRFTNNPEGSFSGFLAPNHSHAQQSHEDQQQCRGIAAASGGAATGAATAAGLFTTDIAGHIAFADNIAFNRRFAAKTVVATDQPFGASAAGTAAAIVATLHSFARGSATGNAGTVDANLAVGAVAIGFADFVAFNGAVATLGRDHADTLCAFASFANTTGAFATIVAALLAFAVRLAGATAIEFATEVTDVFAAVAVFEAEFVAEATIGSVATDTFAGEHRGAADTVGAYFAFGTFTAGAAAAIVATSLVRAVCLADVFYAEAVHVTGKSLSAFAARTAAAIVAALFAVACGDASARVNADAFLAYPVGSAGAVFGAGATVFGHFAKAVAAFGFGDAGATFLALGHADAVPRSLTAVGVHFASASFAFAAFAAGNTLGGDAARPFNGSQADAAQAVFALGALAADAAAAVVATVLATAPRGAAFAANTDTTFAAAAVFGAVGAGLDAITDTVAARLDHGAATAVSDALGYADAVPCRLAAEGVQGADTFFAGTAFASGAFSLFTAGTGVAESGFANTRALATGTATTIGTALLAITIRRADFTNTTDADFAIGTGRVTGHTSEGVGAGRIC